MSGELKQLQVCPAGGAPPPQLTSDTHPSGESCSVVSSCRRLVLRAWTPGRCRLPPPRGGKPPPAAKTARVPAPARDWEPVQAAGTWNTLLAAASSCSWSSGSNLSSTDWLMQLWCMMGLFSWTLRTVSLLTFPRKEQWESQQHTSATSHPPVSGDTDQRV